MVYNTRSTNFDLHTVSAEPNLVVCGRNIATKQRLTHKKAASTQVTYGICRVLKLTAIGNNHCSKGTHSHSMATRKVQPAEQES